MTSSPPSSPFSSSINFVLQEPDHLNEQDDVRSNVSTGNESYCEEPIYWNHEQETDNLSSDSSGYEDESELNESSEWDSDYEDNENNEWNTISDEEENFYNENPFSESDGNSDSDDITINDEVIILLILL